MKKITLIIYVFFFCSFLGFSQSKTQIRKQNQFYNQLITAELQKKYSVNQPTSFEEKTNELFYFKNHPVLLEFNKNQAALHTSNVKKAKTQNSSILNPKIKRLKTSAGTNLKTDFKKTENSSGKNSFEALFNEENFTVKLDSSKTIGFDGDSLTTRYENIYDANQNIIERINYSWNSTQESFVPIFKYEYTYDENNNQTGILYKDWITADFFPVRRDEIRFDENNNMTLYLGYNWDATATAFVPNYKGEHSYDASNREVLYLGYYWDATAATFVTQHKAEKDYNESNVQILNKNYFYQNQVLADGNGWEYSYDTNGKRTLEIEYYFNSETASLDVKKYWERRTEGSTYIRRNFNISPEESIHGNWSNDMTSNANGAFLEDISYEWDTTSQSFHIRGKYEILWDDAGNHLGNNSYSWDANTESMYLAYNSENTLDANGNTIKTENFYRNINGVVTEKYKTEYQYNDNNLQTLSISSRGNTGADSYIPSYKNETYYDETENTYIRYAFSWDANSNQFNQIPQNKYSGIYDNLGNFTTEISYSVNTSDGTTVYTPQSKSEREIGPNSNSMCFGCTNISSEIYYRWDNATSSFIPQNKWENDVDDMNRYLGHRGYEWDTASASLILKNYSVIAYQDVFSRDELTNLSYQLDPETNTFKINRGWEQAYDANGNKILNKEYIPVYVNGTWYTEGHNAWERSYTDNNFQKLDINYSWDTASSSFYTGGKWEHFFDENENEILYIQESYDTSIASLRTYTTYEMRYDSNNNRTFYAMYRHNNESNALVGEQKWEATYNSDSRQTSYADYIWNTNALDFVPTNKWERTYDEDLIDPLVTWSAFKWYPSIEVYKPSFKKVYTIEENDTNLIRKGTASEYDINFLIWSELTGSQYESYWYYTKASTLSSEAVLEEVFSLYPNPSQGYIYINTKEKLENAVFELYDIVGKKILSQQIQASQPIDIQKLVPALYLYKIKQGLTTLKSGKIIKQ